MAATDTLVPMPVAAIVLAAGASRRLGHPKQLIRLDGETLPRPRTPFGGRGRSVSNDCRAGCIQRDCFRFNQKLAAHLALNRQWEQGIATSIHAGLHALDEIAPEAGGALLLGCDQPRLTVLHLHAMISAFDAQAAPTIVASRYAGVLGAPAIFPRQVFPALLALRGDKGARSLLLQPPCPLLAIEFPGGEIDIDWPADLNEIQ